MSFKFINNPKLQNINEEQKSVYDKWLKRQFGKRMPIHIFDSGSDGNSVYLKNYHILIDLGLPYARYQEYDPLFFLDVDTIILTHHHNDHLNPSTLIRILDNYPHIRVIISAQMWDAITGENYRAESIKRDPGETVPFGHDLKFKTHPDGTRMKKPPKYKDDFLKHASKFRNAEPQTLVAHDGTRCLFEPLTVKHGDIVNIAIQISDSSLDFELLYASDLDNLGGARTFTDNRGIPQSVSGLSDSRVYTCMLLEANYDEEILQKWYDNLDPSDPEYRGKKARADGNLRHISEQEASRYIERHLHTEGLFIPLHASRTFGTLYQK